MNRTRLLRLAASVALIPAVAWSVNVALAQSPPAAPPASTTPAAPTPAPAVPAPVAPATPPAAAQAPATPAVPPVVQADPFGEEINLAGKQVVTFSGKANWDSAFDTLMDAFKQITALLDKQGIKSSGNSMIVYTSTDDTGFTFLAEIPVDQEPKSLPKAM
ncbi:MAG: AraC family transcriptional regulator, partial [Tardiphaga sp.]